MNKRNIKIIFFDLGDTLLDMSISRKGLYFGLKSALPDRLVTDKLVSKWERESHKIFDYYYKKGEFYSIKSLQSMSLRNTLLEYGIDLTDRELVDIVSECWQYLIKNCPLYGDVVPILSRLVKDGYELGLITDGDEENVIEILKQHNLNNMFKTITVSSIIKSYKPDLLIFKRALKNAQCLPQDAIYVGDSVNDIRGAKKLGLITVIIYRNKMQSSMWEIKPDFRIDKLRQLYTITNKLRDVTV